MSPCPRVRQPGCSATFRPASSNTSGSQVSEKAMLRDSPYGYRQILIGGRLCVVEVEIASVSVVRHYLPLHRRNAPRSCGKVRIQRDLVLIELDVADTIVVMFVGIGRTLLLSHGVPRAIDGSDGIKM